MRDYFTTEEKEILKKTAELLNAFLTLPIVHEDDISEVRLYIQQLQNLLASRLFR